MLWICHSTVVTVQIWGLLYLGRSCDAHPMQRKLEDTCSGSTDSHPMQIKFEDICSGSGSNHLTTRGTSLLQGSPSAHSKALAVAEEPSSGSRISMTHQQPQALVVAEEPSSGSLISMTQALAAAEEPSGSLIEVPSSGSRISMTHQQPQALAVAKEPSLGSLQSDKKLAASSASAEELQDESLKAASIHQEQKEQTDAHGSTDTQVPTHNVLLQFFRSLSGRLLEVNFVKDPLESVAKAVPELQIRTSSDRWTLMLCIILMMGTCCGLAAAVHAWAYESPV